jgi:peroxiredoxin Q/BCP
VYQDFLDVDCAVVGVSGDTVVSHALFADKHRLPYPILSDAQGTLRKAMQVPKKLFGIIPGRVTYIFNPAGKLIHITNDLMDAEKHVKEALEVIRSVE